MGKAITEPCYRYRAELDRVVDGDTLDVLIDLGFYIRIKERIRLEGVDTPELGTIAQCRMQNKSDLSERLLEFTVSSIKLTVRLIDAFAQCKMEGANIKNAKRQQR